MNKRHILTLIIIFLYQSITFAADKTDFLRSTGKIYVVTVGIAVIFLGIIFFLIYLDRKLTKLENQLKK